MEEKLNSRRKHIIKCQKSRQEKEKCWSDIINWNAFSFFYESKSLDSSPLQVSWFSIARTNWRHRRERQYKRREKRNKKKKYNLKLWFDDHHPPPFLPLPPPLTPSGANTQPPITEASIVQKPHRKPSLTTLEGWGEEEGGGGRCQSSCKHWKA